MECFTQQVFKKPSDGATLVRVMHSFAVDHEEHQLIGNVSGVYLLYQNDDVVYVGQGWNCLLRVAEHTRKESVIEFTSWRYIPIEGDQRRRAEEKKLIEKYQPRYNRQHRRAKQPATSLS